MHKYFLQCVNVATGLQYVFKKILCTCQGQMVAKGTYAELQQSGVDFTSLLKKEEEEEQQSLHETRFRIRTLSQNSVISTTSSLHSVKDGDHLPVCSHFVFYFYDWCCFTGVVSFQKFRNVSYSFAVSTGREGAGCTGGESSSGKHRAETICKIPEGWSKCSGSAGCSDC